MNAPAWLIAAVRTGVQSLIAWAFSSALVVSVVAWIAENLGVTLTEQAVDNFAFGVAITAVTALVNWLGKQPAFQWLNKLISLFLANTPAVYDKPVEGPPDTQVNMGGEDIPGI